MSVLTLTITVEVADPKRRLDEVHEKLLAALIESWLGGPQIQTGAVLLSVERSAEGEATA